MPNPSSTPIASVAISLSSASWVPLGVSIEPGDTVFIRATGTGSVFTGAVTVPATPAGTTPPTGFVGTALVYGFYAANWNTPSDPVNASVYDLAIVAQSAGFDLSARYVQPTTQRRIFCPGDGLYYEFVNTFPDPVQFYAQFNGIGFFYGDYTGTFSVGVYLPLPEAPGTPVVTAKQRKCLPAVRVRWTAATLATSYRVSRDGVLLGTVDASVLDYLDNPVVVAMDYTYTVTAYNGDAEGLPGTASVRVSGFVEDAPSICVFTEDAASCSTFTEDPCPCNHGVSVP